MQLFKTTLPMSSFSRLMKEPLCFTDKSSLLCMDSSRLKSKSNLQEGERWEKQLLTLLQLLSWFISPLIELRIEVPLLGGGSSLGCGLLVRQQDKRNIRIGAVLGASCQGSVDARRSHYFPQLTVMKGKSDKKLIKWYKNLQEWTMMKSLYSSAE